jgi:hypothetical protein
VLLTLLLKGTIMRTNFRNILLTTLSFLFLPSVTLSQRDQQPWILVIDGHPGQAEVIQKDGRAYVDLQSLAEIADGSLSFKANRIILSIRGSNMSPPVAEAPAGPVQTPANESGLSKNFMLAGIEEIATMREWASTMAYAVQNGYQITEDWAANYREKAASNLRLASAAASTEGDRNALQLLTNEFDSVHEWSNKLVEAKRAMDTAKYALSPGALRDEALSQKIISCGRFLAKMLGSSSFQDDPSCH